VTHNRKRWNIVLRGHYGFGKTVLALLIAATVGTYCYHEHPSDSGKVSVRNRASIQVIDECHLIKGFEALYPYMASDNKDGKNFIFCTNMASKLPEPFLSRCLVYWLSPYTPEELAKIVELHSRLEGTPLGEDVCRFIADRSRGVPRNAVVTMEEYVAECMERRRPYNSVDTINWFFSMEGIDGYGLNDIDRKYLTAVSTHPKSQKTLMALLDRDQDEMERIERHLIQTGLIEITSRGRLAI